MRMLSVLLVLSKLRLWHTIIPKCPFVPVFKLVAMMIVLGHMSAKGAVIAYSRLPHEILKSYYLNAHADNEIKRIVLKSLNLHPYDDWRVATLSGASTDTGACSFRIDV